MGDGELIGVLMAATLAVLAFGVSRWAVRHFARRRAAQGRPTIQATQSRQVRRSNERRKQQEATRKK